MAHRSPFVDANRWTERLPKPPPNASSPCLLAWVADTPANVTKTVAGALAWLRDNAVGSNLKPWK